MTTHERELTEPVDLCTPDGLMLNTEALGWSRRPLHRANLAGRFGINKRWDYWAILAGDLIVSTTYADVDHLGLADVYWANLVAGETGGRSIVVGAEGGIVLPEITGDAPLTVDQDSLRLSITDDEGGSHISASWIEADGRPGRLEAFVELPDGHESLNVVIPWSDELFNFTSKHQARPAHGELVVGDHRHAIGGPDGPLAWGVLDVGRGRWPAKINWNWGGGAGLSGEHVIGLQFGAKWTAGSGFTENGLIVDGRLSKLGIELDWTYDWDRPMEPWRVVDPGGQLDVTLSPRFDRHSQMEVSEDLGSEVHQVFGTWSGRLRTDDGVELEFDGLQGFAEEARQRW
jgi:hypothetical protein